MFQQFSSFIAIAKWGNKSQRVIAMQTQTDLVSKLQTSLDVAKDSEGLFQCVMTVTIKLANTSYYTSTRTTYQGRPV